MTDRPIPGRSSEPVECHSGYTYAERPIALLWRGERLPIEAIEDAWRIPGGRRFRVRTRDGRAFELFYGELYDEWRIHPLQADAPGSPPPSRGPS